MEKKRIFMEVPYFQVPNDIFEIGLDKHELLVYIYLARCGNQCSASFPSYNTIAKKTGISRRKVIECVKSLEEKQLLMKERRYDFEKLEYYSNLYRLEHDVKNRGSAHNALGSEYDALCSEPGAPYKETDYKELEDKEPNNSNLHRLDKLNDGYITTYLSIMQEYGLTHKRVSTSNLFFIVSAITLLKDNDVELEDWVAAVRKHFQTLPKSNDGDIVAFLTASKRYFDVDVVQEISR